MGAHYVQLHSPSRLRAAAVLIPAAAVVAAAWALVPEQATWLPACPFHWTTGLYCPGCGTLRALHQLLHGNLGAALALNPLTVLLAPVLAYSLGREVATRLVRHSPAKPSTGSAAGSWVLVAVILAFWIARNIPVYPFALLAPH